MLARRRRLPPVRLIGPLMAALVASVLAASACDGPGSGSDGPATTIRPAVNATASSGTTPSPLPLQVDWAAPASAALPGGWRLSDCPGDAPLVCVALRGNATGQLEIISMAVSMLPDLSAALVQKGEAVTLREHALHFIADLTADRAVGCGRTYQFIPDEPRQVPTPDGITVRYGVAGTLPDGRPSEKIIQYAGFRGDRLVLLSATASDPGGCLADGGQFFTSAQLTSFAPVLDQVVNASGLPRPTG